MTLSELYMAQWHMDGKRGISHLANMEISTPNFIQGASEAYMSHRKISGISIMGSTPFITHMTSELGLSLNQVLQSRLH